MQDVQTDVQDEGRTSPGLQGGEDDMPNFSSGAAGAAQGAELDQGPLLELKQ